MKEEPLRRMELGSGFDLGGDDFAGLTVEFLGVKVMTDNFSEMRGMPEWHKIISDAIGRMGKKEVHKLLYGMFGEPGRSPFDRDHWLEIRIPSMRTEQFDPNYYDPKDFGRSSYYTYRRERGTGVTHDLLMDLTPYTLFIVQTRSEAQHAMEILYNHRPGIVDAIRVDVIDNNIPRFQDRLLQWPGPIAVDHGVWENTFIQGHSSLRDFLKYAIGRKNFRRTES